MVKKKRGSNRKPTMDRDTMDSRLLTPRQLEILTFIRDYRRSRGYSPTLQEIADDLGVSKITVFEHAETLLEKGMLTRVSNKARSLEPTSQVRFPDERATIIPMLGRIAAGVAIEAIEQNEVVDLEDVFASRYPVGILSVTGDSMVDDQIREGDWVVFEKRPIPRNGDTVIALIDGDKATLKRYYKEKNRIRLQPSNENYKPIFVKDVEIQGVVIGIIRRY